MVDRHLGLNDSEHTRLSYPSCLSGLGNVGVGLVFSSFDKCRMYMYVRLVEISEME
jgi:hypothetical protein